MTVQADVVAFEAQMACHRHTAIASAYYAHGQLWPQKAPYDSLPSTDTSGWHKEATGEAVAVSESHADETFTLPDDACEVS